MIIALIGNQNCGKTTLFNQLTGSNQHVGNFPGVTVEKKSGTVRQNRDLTVVDLPGIYSLSPYTAEEVVTRDFLINEKPDAVINIVDATNIERNLYLTLQLLELGVPTVLALNMMDEVRANGSVIDFPKLSEELGVEALPISANKNEGVSELVRITARVAANKIIPKRLDFCSGEVHTAIHSLAHIIEAKAKKEGYPVRFAATKLVEGDEIVIKRLALNENETDIVGHIVTEMENAVGMDREAALADERYNFIEKICARAVKKGKVNLEQQRSVKIDNILTHKYFAIPIFLGIMLLIFWLTFSVIGAFFQDLMEQGIEALVNSLDVLLGKWEVNAAVHSLIIDGICAGVGSVLSFLPIIVILFMFLSLLEDSGYMARVAFVMDKLLRKIGLSGRSFVPMIIGFGCSVPAIMATRTLASERDRKMTIMLIPFMSCSAKLPIYALITSAFFEDNAPFVMLGLYVLGMVCGILSSLLLKNTAFRGKPIPFVMELPAYRFPSVKTVLLHMWERTKDFIMKAFTIIFIASIIIWFLRSFDITFTMVDDSSKSMLAGLGKLLEPVFKPLGFGDWRAVTALIGGLTAKEAVVSTLAVLMGVTQLELQGVVGTVFATNAAAASFLVFTLLYMPCFAAMAAVKREMGSALKAFFVMLYQTAFAYGIAFIIYRILLLVW